MNGKKGWLKKAFSQLFFWSDRGHFAANRIAADRIAVDHIAADRIGPHGINPRAKDGAGSIRLPENRMDWQASFMRRCCIADD